MTTGSVGGKLNSDGKRQLRLQLFPRLPPGPRCPPLLPVDCSMCPPRCSTCASAVQVHSARLSRWLCTLRQAGCEEVELESSTPTQSPKPIAIPPVNRAQEGLAAAQRRILPPVPASEPNTLVLAVAAGPLSLSQMLC